VAADPVAVRILDLFDQWRTPEDLFRALPQYSRASLQTGLRQLTDKALLVKYGTPAARQDALLEKAWSNWLPEGSFHFSTKDVNFAWGRSEAKLFKKLLAESAPPALTKLYPVVPQQALPRCPAPDGEFLRVLLARRTHREFSTSPVPLTAISHLLYYTWGVTGYLSTPLGRLFHKTSPSGGARHPVEVYLLALRVKGLSPGLYHYNVRSHRLELLREGRMHSKAVQYCGGQEWVKDAAALFLMTAVFARSMWKYRFARAYRIVLLDAGHLCQTFCLTATWLGLAPFCTAALKDTLIEKDLGLDGITESILYVAGVGVPRSSKPVGSAE
jgi:SagB-type dehydrogenase family enzyme